jgi:hypothetical protein
MATDTAFRLLEAALIAVAVLLRVVSCIEIGGLMVRGELANPLVGRAVLARLLSHCLVFSAAVGMLSSIFVNLDRPLTVRSFAWFFVTWFAIVEWVVVDRRPHG